MLEIEWLDKNQAKCHYKSGNYPSGMLLVQSALTVVVVKGFEIHLKYNRSKTFSTDGNTLINDKESNLKCVFSTSLAIVIRATIGKYSNVL